MELKLITILKFLSLITFLSVIQAQMVEQDVDVLILGAGAAGIAAARTFQENDPNLRILILEAGDRAGGRIRSEPMVNTNPNDPVILTSAGAQWLHGKGNPLYEYALKKNFVVEDGSEEGLGPYIRDVDQVTADPAFVGKINDIVEEIYDACGIFANDTSIPYPPSFNGFLTTEFERRIQEMSDSDKIVAWQLLDWHKRFQVIDNGALHVALISAKEWGRKWVAGGEWTHISFKNGFAEVIETMASELKPNTILYNKNVTNISYGSEMLRVLVRCDDISYYTATHVIVTFSLGVLKEYHFEMFNPWLPPMHREAIKCLGYGPITKIILQFHDNWWGNEEGLQLLHESDSDYEVSGFRCTTRIKLTFCSCIKQIERTLDPIHVRV